MSACRGMGRKQVVGMAVACAVIVGCAAGPTARPSDPTASRPAVAYVCEAQPIALVGHGNSLEVQIAGRDLPVANHWRDTDGDHFVVWTRNEIARRSLAVEYVLPVDRGLDGQRRIYERGRGATYSVVAPGDGSWRIEGNPTSFSVCPTETHYVATVRGRQQPIANAEVLARESP